MVVIDPGHGGSDPGALGNNLQEKDYNLLISKYMYDRFRELGIPVAITRNEDVTLGPTERTDIILDAFELILMNAMLVAVLVLFTGISLNNENISI